MIKPATLWGLFKSCDDSTWLGDICRALGGQSVTLDYGQAQMVKTVTLDSGWLDEAVEARRQKWSEKKRGQRGTKGTCPQLSPVPGDNDEKGTTVEMSPVPTCPPPSVLPFVRSSVRSSVLPDEQDSIRSVSVPVKGVQGELTTPTVAETERNGNGTDDFDVVTIDIGVADDAVNAFAGDIRKNGEAAFFFAENDPVVAAVYVTGDRKSARRWRQAVAKVGEGAFRDELFSFWREICAGEVVRNRGAALNARLKRLEVENA